MKIDKEIYILYNFIIFDGKTTTRYGSTRDGAFLLKA